MPDERTYGLCNACDNPLAALHYVFALHRYAKCGLQRSVSLTPPQFSADSAATAKRAGDRLYRGIGHDIDKKTGIARSRRSDTISALAEQFDVSRKFVYGQAHKADLALDNVFYPMECENVWIPSSSTSGLPTIITTGLNHCRRPERVFFASRTETKSPNG